MTAHYFEFSTNWLGTDRLCKACGLTYETGDHIEITTLKPMTNYVCPTGGGYGHKSIYTGAYRPTLRTLRDHICICGAEMVEEDKERWLVTFELDQGSVWHPVETVHSKHAAQQQHEGLLAAIKQGEPIRNVTLRQLVEVSRDS